MKPRERFNFLCAKSLANTLSPEELQEFEALLSAEPENQQTFEELRTVSPVLAEFAPLMDALHNAPPANFPEHRMGQFRTAVWEEFRDRVPQRSTLLNRFAWLWDRALPISAAAAAGVIVIGLVLFPPQQPQQENLAQNLTAQDGRKVEFGVYNPVGYGDYTVQDLLERLNMSTSDALGVVDGFNAAAQPIVEELSFEMVDAFEQWKQDSLDSTTYARVWVDKDLDTLHIITREGENGQLERVTMNLPTDGEKRNAVIEETLQELAKPQPVPDQAQPRTS